MKSDFVVVGGGIAGASVAYALADRASVIVLEREPQAGYHSTGRSAATWIESWERGVARALTAASRDFLSRPPEGFTDDPLAYSLPMMVIAREDQLSSLSEVAASGAGVDGLVELEGPAAVAACPALRHDYVAGAILEPGALGLDVDALLQGFMRGARERGARILTGAAATDVARIPGAWRVSTPTGTVTAETLVNASGAWADEVAGMADIEPLGLIPHRRTAFAFNAPDGADMSDWPLVADVDADFYFKPEGTLLMGSLAEETPLHPHDVRPDEIDVALAVERINAATTFDIRHVVRAWAGLRTFAPDHQPVVGPDPRDDGFFWLAGQGGFGVMTSPATAALAAGLALEGRVPDELASAGIGADQVSPGRFLE